MLIKITERDYKYLYHFLEHYLDFRGVQCQDCKKKINYLRKEDEIFIKCPKCRFATSVLFEEEYFDVPDYGLSHNEIVRLKERLQNSFEYEPDKFDDDEELPLDTGLRFWYTD